jgi:hypothetical protein
MRPIVKMTSYWKCPTSEITKFSCTENSLQCYNENEPCEEAIAEQTAAEHQKTSEGQEIDEEDTTKREQVTNRAARKCIAGLRLYII